MKQNPECCQCGSKFGLKNCLIAKYSDGDADYDWFCWKCLDTPYHMPTSEAYGYAWQASGFEDEIPF